MRKVEGIIIDSDSSRRMRLRQACMEVPQLAKVQVAPTLQDALKCLSTKGEVEFTAIFISERMSKVYFLMLPAELGKASPPLLTLKQENIGAVSAKRRAYLRAVERLKARGIETSSFNEEEGTEDEEYSDLWELSDTGTNSKILVLNIDLYDRPTSDCLVKFIGKQLAKEPTNIEIDLSNTKSISTYALAQVVRCKNMLREHQRELGVKSSRGFNEDVFAVLKLSEVFVLRS